jgi:hypothetical protein
MLAKLGVLVVGVGVIACGLLGIRQARIQAAHEMADVQRRIARHDRELWQLRAEISRRVTPDKAEEMGRKLGPLVGISPERYTELVRAEQEAADASALTRVDGDDRSSGR